MTIRAASRGLDVKAFQPTSYCPQHPARSPNQQRIGQQESYPIPLYVLPPKGVQT